MPVARRRSKSHAGRSWPGRLLAIFLLVVAPAGDYAIIDYPMHHGTLPLGSVAVVLSTSFPLWLVLIAIMLWVFPDGLLPAGRWRPVAVILVTGGLLLAVAATAAGAAVAAGHTVIIDASGNLANKTTGLTSALQGLSAIGALASLLTSEVLPFRTPVAVAVATLAAAALFNPLRRRVQRAVDRRFNRSRYDAEAVIAEFTVRLRGTVDLDAVRDDLTGAVRQAFEPAHAGDVTGATRPPQHHP